MIKNLKVTKHQRKLVIVSYMRKVWQELKFGAGKTISNREFEKNQIMLFYM